MSAARKLFSGVAWSSSATIGQKLFSMLVLLVLVRLLSSKDFGTAATASMIVATVQPVVRLGTFNYLIQHQALNDRIRTSVLVTAAILGVLFSAVLFVSAGPIAHAFSDERLKSVVQALSPIFAFRALTVVHEAMLTKQFGFKALAVRSMGSVIASGLLAIASAFAGYGLYSLVVQQLALAVFSTLFLINSYRWKLDFTDCRSQVKDLLPIGVRYTISDLLSSFNNSSYGLIIGLFLSTEAAGIFRLAWTALDFCLHLTVRPFLQVAQPIFAEVRRNPPDLAAAYLRLTRIAALFTFLVYGWVGAMGYEVGRFLYGARFESAGHVLSIICVVVFLATPNYLIATALVALGKPGELIRLSLAQCAASLVLAAISAPFGLSAVAAAYILRAVLTTPLSLHYLHRETGVTMAGIWKALAPPLVASILMVGAIEVFSATLGAGQPLILKLLGSGTLALAVYIPAIALMDRNLNAEVRTFAKALRTRA